MTGEQWFAIDLSNPPCYVRATDRMAGVEYPCRMLPGISTSYLNRMFPDEWVLAEVLDSDVGNRPTRVRVIAHSHDRHDVHSVLMQSRGHLVLLFVAAPNGRGVAF